MKLAIIIPTYDNLTMLKALVRQIYTHTKDFNLYIIEDGQKSKTINYLADLLGEKDNFVPILHRENVGVATSWNHGLKRAVKDGCTHFAIMNDDIEITKGWWEECKNKLSEGYDLLSLGFSENTPVFSGWFFVITKKTLDVVGYFDESFGKFYYEDADYSLRFNATSLKGGVVNIPVKHHESTTIEKNIKLNNPKLYKRVVATGKEALSKKYDSKLIFHE